MRYFIEIAYNGKNYQGWQVQPNGTSIQETITNAISIILSQDIKLTGAGRTDTGVHALQMFAHFDVEKPLNTVFLVKRLNAFLPDDIIIKDILLVDNEAHARFGAVYRSYEYRIYLGRNPFLLDVTWQIHQNFPDIALMNEAASYLLKYTDFKCFSKSNSDVKTYNCAVMRAEWILKDNQLTFYITADRFLRNMVRAIVGTLMQVGLKKRRVADFIKVIESRDRRKAGYSVPPQGLFLTEVGYPTKLLRE